MNRINSINRINRINYIRRVLVPEPSQANLLSLSERLTILALDTDRAGFGVASEHLLHLASQFLDQPDSLR
jgi:hypothetical protein